MFDILANGYVCARTLTGLKSLERRTEVQFWTFSSSPRFSPSVTVGFSGQERNLGAIECLERK